MAKHEVIKNYCKRTGKDYDMIVDDAFRLYLALENPLLVLRCMVMTPECFRDLSYIEEKCRRDIFSAVKSTIRDYSWEE